MSRRHRIKKEEEEISTPRPRFVVVGKWNPPAPKKSKRKKVEEEPATFRHVYPNEAEAKKDKAACIKRGCFDVKLLDESIA